MDDGFSKRRQEQGMIDAPDILKRAFDHLSAFPYLNLKVLMKRMWWFQLCFTPLAYILGFLYGDSSVMRETVTTRTIASYLLGSAIFGYMFHLWDKHDREKNAQVDWHNDNIM